MSEVTIGSVYFKEEDPCRPRYVDLYRDQEPLDDPMVQVEPAFQVGPAVKELKVRVELAKGEVDFTKDDKGQPLCRELNAPEKRPRIGYGGSPSSCVLTWVWEPAAPPTRVFRIYCHRSGHKLTDEAKVHGGIFVAVTTSLSQMRHHIPQNIPDSVKLHDIVVIGTDSHGRPVYDTFKQREEPQPFEVELAPAFRARESKALNFVMTMGIEEASWNGKVEYIQPAGKQPAYLKGEYDQKYPKKYYFHWQAPDRGCGSSLPPEDCYRGEIVTFHLEPQLDPHFMTLSFPWRLSHAGFKGWDDYAAALKKINVDPTIIQPPPCDPVYRVCSA